MSGGGGAGIHGSVGSQAGTLFQYRLSKPLTQAGFIGEVKAALERGGMSSEGYSGHSFRIGAATTAAAAGIGDAVIQQLGHWRSEAYKGYVQPEQGRLAGIPWQMAKQGAGEASGESTPINDKPRRKGRKVDLWTPAVYD